jgi:putative membrane protein
LEEQQAMKYVSAAALVVGVITTALLISQAGVRDIADAAARVGWGTPLAVLVRIIGIGIAGVAWWLVVTQPGWVELHMCVIVRYVREAVNTLLPVAQVGGDFVGARLLSVRGVAPPLATAATLADVFLQAVAQVLFTALGLWFLIRTGGDAAVVQTVAWGLAAAVPLLAGFYLLLRAKAQGLIATILRRLAGDRQWAALGAMDRVYDDLAAIQAHSLRMVASAVTHLFVWLFASLEVYVVLGFIGYPVSLADAVVIESLAQALRGAAFAVPGAIGVQEGGLIVLCGLFGVPADAALALSLIKRVADLSLGLPGLFAWQSLERRNSISKPP